MFKVLKEGTYDSCVDFLRRNFSDEVDGPLVVDLLLEAGDREPRVPGVCLVPLLPGVRHLVPEAGGGGQGARGHDTRAPDTGTQPAQNLPCHRHSDYLEYQ